MVALHESANAVDEASNDPWRLGIRHPIVLGFDRDVLVFVAERPHWDAQRPVRREECAGVPDRPTASPITHLKPLGLGVWPMIRPFIRSL